VINKHFIPFFKIAWLLKKKLLVSSDSLKMNCRSYKKKLSVQSLAWIRPGVPEILHYKCRLCFEKKHTETLTYGYSKVRSWAGDFKYVIYFKICTLWFFIKFDLIIFFQGEWDIKKNKVTLFHHFFNIYKFR
jgi:hypothetical protein